MTFRVLSSDEHPSRLIAHIRSTGCVARRAETAYRGPLAIVGGGQVRAVANLSNVKPIAGKGESGFLWCIDQLREIRPIPCAVYGAEATFMNGDKLEPQFLNAGAQAELGRYLSPVEMEMNETIEPEEEEKLSPMPPDYGTEAPKPSSQTSQMSLF